MPTVTIKLSAAEHAKLKATAARRRTTKSAVMREAFAQQSSSTPNGSLYDRVKHLMGSINGPGDLSTNPRHMEGYGKSRRP